MDNTKEANTLIKCMTIGYNGCHYCPIMYKHQCLVGITEDLDYLKALIDLDMEFDAGKVLNFEK